MNGNSVVEQDKAPLLELELELEFELEELELDAEELEPELPVSLSPPQPEKTLTRNTKITGLITTRWRGMDNLHWRARGACALEP